MNQDPSRDKNIAFLNQEKIPYHFKSSLKKIFFHHAIENYRRVQTISIKNCNEFDTNLLQKRHRSVMRMY